MAKRGDQNKIDRRMVTTILRWPPPDLPTYRERGHRCLDAKTYSAMSYTEENWVDEDATSHRCLDD